MKLLAIETATEACSVAILSNGVVSERFEIAPRRHTDLVLPWAEALLAETGVSRSQLDAIAVGRGPGAFTGVRLGIALAQGLALALDRPLVPVSTLAVLAQGARVTADDAPILAAIDARMGEVYVGAFRRDGDRVEAISGEEVVRPDAWVAPEAGQRWIGVGTGFAAVDGALARRLEDRLLAVDDAALPHAADLARLAAVAWAGGGGIAPERVEPAYLRNNVALTIVEQQALRASRNDR